MCIYDNHRPAILGLSYLLLVVFIITKREYVYPIYIYGCDFHLLKAVCNYFSTNYELITIHYTLKGLDLYRDMILTL